MTVDLDKLEITHNEANHTFEVWIEGHLSKLDYIQDGKNFVITHVGVYPELRGQGIAGKIDYLRGLKENVIMGRPIPAGTGMLLYRNIKVVDEAFREEEPVKEDIMESTPGRALPPG